jgi:protein TonB
MRPAPDLAYRYRPDWRQRAPALLLALAAAGLILLALMRLGLLPSPIRPPESELNTFNVSPPSPTAGGATKPPDPAKAATERAAPPPAAPPPPPPVPRPADIAAPVFPDILILRGDKFARSDIGRLPTEARGSGETAASGADTASAYGPGEGPGGERLFNAEWQVEPTNAQLTGYLPPTGAPPGSWATIACRTIERYEVENCRALSEFPVGSGLARAMRQAAWQFRVRPPRIGGRPQIGAWVRIRITFGTRPD